MYFEGLANIAEIELPLDDDEDYKSSWHIFHIKCVKRDDLSVFLQNNQIATGVHYAPIHTYKCYGNRPALKTAEAVAPRILTLPLYPDLSDDDVAYIIDKIREFYGK